MAKRNPAPETPERVRNFLNQKPRTTSEEKAAWTRRVRRWKRKFMASNDLDTANAELANARALGEDQLSRDSSGLALWKFKAAKVLGFDEANALLTAAIGASE